MGESKLQSPPLGYGVSRPLYNKWGYPRMNNKKHTKARKKYGKFSCNNVGRSQHQRDMNNAGLELLKEAGLLSSNYTVD